MGTESFSNPLKLIHDQNFVDWATNPTPESDLYWTEFIRQNPEREAELNNAIFIIKSLRKKEKAIDDEEVIQLWNQIKNNAGKKRKNIFLRPGGLAAASIILLLGISGVVYFLFNQKPEELNYQAIAKVEAPDNEIKLIFADKTEEVITSDKPEIKYDSNGQIIVNSGQRLSQKLAEEKNAEEQLNQLVVPCGKRTSLTLADGTRLWLNSGSRAIFPVVFTKQKREVFIEGEAYLEVAHDARKPFFVVTNNINLRVLGTKFNVSAYPEDPSASVVLVEGSVQTTANSKTTTMKPNQLFTYQKSSGETSLNETDVLPYISWKDGWMYCDKEDLESIATKLSRYYNVKIDFKDQQARKMTLTGKLDLKTECTDILKVISSTAPISFAVENNSIVINTRNK